MNKTKTKITLEHSAQIRCAYQLSGVRGKKLLDMFPNYSKAQIYVHAKKTIGGEKAFDKRSVNKGRPKVVTEKQERRIIRSVKGLRTTEGSFSSSRVQLDSGTMDVSNRAVRRVLNKNGYKYLQSRKKGLLYERDLKCRLKFCRKMIHEKTQQFWNYGISFYLDGKGFEYKSNPLDQARAPKAREWRQVGEGLSYGCVAKGKKEGATNANFMVAISHGKGAVMCRQYFGAITGGMFAKIVRDEFETAFMKSSNPNDKLFLMDGCPRQNSKLAKQAIERAGATIFSIPPRSPDLNPIENFFHLVSNALSAEVINRRIEKETFEEYSLRVKNCIMNFPVSEVDKIIETMEKRVKLVIQAKGQRTKY